MNINDLTIGHILNKHTKSCLSELKNFAYKNKELKRRLSAAEAKLPRWIPVEERLPEERVAVLICIDGIKVSYGHHISGGWYEDTIPLEIYGETVTHWMPRPEAPESGKGE